MSARRALVNAKRVVLDEPPAKDLGRAFLRPEGIKRLVVASPGNISVECELSDQEPKAKLETNE